MGGTGVEKERKKGGGRGKWEGGKGVDWRGGGEKRERSAKYGYLTKIVMPQIIVVRGKSGSF